MSTLNNFWMRNQETEELSTDRDMCHYFQGLFWNNVSSWQCEIVTSTEENDSNEITKTNMQFQITGIEC